LTAILECLEPEEEEKRQNEKEDKTKDACHNNADQLTFCQTGRITDS
jgi:hypothetical protein